MFLLECTLRYLETYVKKRQLRATSPSFQRNVPPGDSTELTPKKIWTVWPLDSKNKIVSHNKSKIFWQTWKSVSHFLKKNTPSRKIGQNYHFPKNFHENPDCFVVSWGFPGFILTSGVGSSTATVFVGSKHFWMKRCTAARGSADNSNLTSWTGWCEQLSPWDLICSDHLGSGKWISIAHLLITIRTAQVRFDFGGIYSWRSMNCPFWFERYELVVNLK